MTEKEKQQRWQLEQELTGFRLLAKALTEVNQKLRTANQALRKQNEALENQLVETLERVEENPNA